MTPSPEDSRTQAPSTSLGDVAYTVLLSVRVDTLLALGHTARTRAVSKDALLQDILDLYFRHGKYANKR